DGQHKTLYTLEGPLPELAYRPITVEFTSAADLENQLVPEITIGETTETGVRFVPDKLDSLRITYHSVIGERERHYRQPLFRNPERERRLPSRRRRASDGYSEPSRPCSTADISTG
ncbi:MAG: hypothetical protein ABEL76_15230, partial [Bradymonadaceae bacterium]